MATSFSHRVAFDAPASAVHAALTSEEHWRDLAATINPDNTTFDGISTDDKGTTVAITQRVDAHVLPSIVQKIRSGDLYIRRHQSIGALAGDSASGELSADIEGTPASLTGTLTLTGSGETSVLVFTGASTVKVPLLGGKIEKIVNDAIVAIIGVETKFTSDWIASH